MENGLVRHKDPQYKKERCDATASFLYFTIVVALCEPRMQPNLRTYACQQPPEPQDMQQAIGSVSQDNVHY